MGKLYLKILILLRKALKARNKIKFKQIIKENLLLVLLFPLIRNKQLLLKLFLKIQINIRIIENNNLYLFFPRKINLF